VAEHEANLVRFKRGFSPSLGNTTLSHAP
jgi:hypothetical protein